MAIIIGCGIMAALIFGLFTGMEIEKMSKNRRGGKEG